MSEQRIDDGGPAFTDSASWPMFPQQVAFRPADGQPEFASHYGGDWATGMTLRQYAAIKLKVPNSGIDWLDQMIRESLRDEFAARAMQGRMEAYSDFSPEDVDELEIGCLAYPWRFPHPVQPARGEAEGG